MSNEPTLSPQVQQRLLQLTAQLDAMQGQLDRLTAISRLNSDQVAALTTGLTDPLAAETTRTQLVELSSQMADYQEQMTSLQQMLAGQSQRDEALFAQLAQLSEQQASWEPLVRNTANQEQLTTLAQKVASTEQINELLDTVKKLNRTQFKSNAITESKETQVGEAIKTLQGVVNRREELQADQVVTEQQRLSETRLAARGELAADLFPALDGLELALAKGRESLQRLRNEQQVRIAEVRQTLTDLLQANKEPIDASFWANLRQKLGGSPNAEVSARNAGIDLLSQELAQIDITTEPASLSTIESWLEGLELVRDRFLKLFAAEGITPIPAEGQTFDPRVHVAIETQVRSDVEPDTIVTVLQTGYRQQRRVLRYAEVVVARSQGNDLTV